MIEVDSSSVESVKYSNGVLIVKFVSGGIYMYERVPRRTFDAMMDASSIGSYFAATIRGNKAIPYTKIA